MDYNTFTQNLEHDFPHMFTDLYGGVCVGEGWWHIVHTLCRNIQQHVDHTQCPPVQVTQIKEKFGGLRFYYSGGDDCVDSMVRLAESWAASTCEVCGDRGSLVRTGGWLRVVCEKHAK